MKPNTTTTIHGSTAADAQERQPTAPCLHGKRYFCGLCSAEEATKCEHGKPFFCTFCADKRNPAGV